MFSATRFIAVAAVLAGLTSAQGTLPPCATECVTQFTTGSSIGGCNSLNIACICENKNFLSGIACCLAGKCSVADQQAATSYAQNFCKISGVTDLPTAVSCTSTASSTASAAPSSASSSAASVTSSVSSAESSASSVSHASSSVSSAVSSVSSSVSSIAASVSSQVSSTSSAAASASPTKNAGPQNVAVLGAGVFGGLVAVVALL